MPCDHPSDHPKNREETNPPSAVTRAPWRIICYTDSNRRLAVAAYQIIQRGTYRQFPVVILAEPPAYNGTSITNGFEFAATALAAEGELGDPTRAVFVEHYPAGLEWRDGDEAFALVSLSWSRRNDRWQASAPDWIHAARELVEMLCGRPLEQL